MGVETQLLRELEVCWAAGLFEGEGNVSFHGPENWHGRRRGRLVMTMKEESVVKRFAEIVGCGRIYVHDRREKGLFYSWQNTKEAEFRKVVALLYPWLGERRREAMKAAFLRGLLPTLTGKERWEIRRERYGPNGRKQK